MECKRVCLDYVAKTSKPRDKGRYESGQKRCSFCDVFIVFNGNRCPCCNCMLRKKPKLASYRSKLIETPTDKNN